MDRQHQECGVLGQPHNNANNEQNKTYLSDCKTAFMKHVLPRLRKPVVFGRKD